MMVLALVLAGDGIGAQLLAPLAVDELTPIHAPVVFAVLTILGMEPAAAGSAVARFVVDPHPGRTGVEHHRT